jgi:Flp pilus assembly protein TadD
MTRRSADSSTSRPAAPAPVATRRRRVLRVLLAGPLALAGMAGMAGMAGLGALYSPPAQAADTSEPAPARATDPLAAARKRIEAGQWSAAITELRRVNATGSADWNNLMGYALRKQTPPDLEGAQRHYDAALRIDPKHQGALEYAGELALMKGDLATAEAHLATLSGLCRSPCEPLDDLQKAIARYKTQGNRWQP